MDTMASSQQQRSTKQSNSEDLVDRFLDAIWTERGLSANTLGAYRADLMTLWRGLSGQDIRIENAEKSDLLAFIARRVESGAKPRSTARQLSSFRRFFRYIMREGLRDTDPTADIEMPRIGRSLPKTLTEDEVDALLHAPSPDEPLGHRDRTMLELLYATGLRVSELINLRQSQVNFNQGVLQTILIIVHVACCVTRRVGFCDDISCNVVLIFSANIQAIDDLLSINRINIRKRRVDNFSYQPAVHIVFIADRIGGLLKYLTYHIAKLIQFID